MTIFQFSFGDGFAGSAKVALLSSRILKDRGIKVVLFVSNGSLTEKRAGEYNLDFISLDDHAKYKILMTEIDQYFEIHKPDIVIGHHSLDRKIGISLKRRHPEVINIAYRHNITKSVPLIGSYIYNHYTDSLIACSKGVAESLTNSGIKKNKVKVIYNGIYIPGNIMEINGDKVRERYGLQDKRVLGMSTWFHKERKGFDIVFDSFSALQHLYCLLLVGIPVEQKDEVLEYAAEFGISPESIIMPGYVENIWEYYKAMDLFLLPSRSEGFSLALLEAAASGIPIIASDIPGNNEFIENYKNGILFNMEEQGQLKDKIMELYNDKELAEKLRKNAQKKALNTFTLQKYTDNLQKYLKSLLVKKSGS